ncbi:MAG TPA: NusG domain II-containing protein [Ignavibacteriaceae bacterium]|nr:NusG domain II-containing protein [Ignavibacteriaceae bacterium]
MISRRDFLKLAGVSAAALGAGYSTGKLIDNKNFYFSVNGFIPADEKILHNLITAFKKKVKSNTIPSIYAEEHLKKIIYSIDKSGYDENFSNDGLIEYRIYNLKKEFKSDIIVSDDKNSVYSPDQDFNLAFASLRRDLKNKNAEYGFSALYKTESLFSNLFGIKKDLVIENENGIVDKIKSGRSYKNIAVKGPLGITGVSVADNMVKVHSSCCRNEICRHSIISQPGEIIACAPNKILIHFEA